MTFGILDFGFRQLGLNSLEKLQDVLETAVLADKLGYSRYWIAEHHFSQLSLSWSNPQALISLLASSTKKIRVGIAGVQLAMYSPYHIATFFKLINNIHQNRIDLGIATSRPNAAVMHCLPDQFDIKSDYNNLEYKIEKLIHYLNDDDTLYNNGKGGIVIPPYGGHSPQLWSLTSSAYSNIDKIIRFKMNLSRSICHELSDLTFARNKYENLKQEFYNKNSKDINTNLVIGIICNQSHKKALKIASSFKQNNQYINIMGDFSAFKDKILFLSEEYGYKDFILYDYDLDIANRRKTIKAISKMFDLEMK